MQNFPKLRNILQHLIREINCIGNGGFVEFQLSNPQFPVLLQNSRNHAKNQNKLIFSKNYAFTL